MVKNQGIKVDLPRATTGTRQAQNNRYTAITVTEKGEIFFNKTKISPSQLPDLLKNLKSTQNDPIILLNGDEKAALGRAIYVLDEAGKLGIRKVAIETKS